MKQSSVEWFIQKITDSGFLWVHEYDNAELTKYIEQAKAMHKQEHEDAYIEGSKCKSDGWAWNLEDMKEMAKDNYKETFKSE